MQHILGVKIIFNSQQLCVISFYFLNSTKTLKPSQYGKIYVSAFAFSTPIYFCWLDTELV